MVIISNAKKYLIMDEKRMKELAEKIKNGNANDDEKLEFFGALNELLKGLKDDLSGVQKEN